MCSHNQAGLYLLSCNRRAACPRDVDSETQPAVLNRISGHDMLFRGRSYLVPRSRLSNHSASVAAFKGSEHMGQIIPAPECPWSPNTIFMNMTTALVIGLYTRLTLVFYLIVDCIRVECETADKESTTGQLK